jgi:sirohydrochlorin ferrochelatase
MSANDEMFRVLDVIRARHEFDIVEAGFLECNEPDIPTAIAGCVNRGAREIVAVPYFLHTGKHVANDLPTLFEAAKERYPLVQFRLSDFIGRSPRISDILESRAIASLEQLPD